MRRSCAALCLGGFLYVSRRVREGMRSAILKGEVWTAISGWGALSRLRR
jgi:hypothetical protein